MPTATQTSLTSLGFLAILGAFYFVSPLRAETRRAARHRGGVYEDEDGVATRASENSYTLHTRRTQVFMQVSTLVGLLLSVLSDSLLGFPLHPVIITVAWV